MYIYIYIYMAACHYTLVLKVASWGCVNSHLRGVCKLALFVLFSFACMHIRAPQPCGQSGSITASRVRVWARSRPRLSW